MTPEEARQELARRELAKRQQTPASQTSRPRAPGNLLQQGGQLPMQATARVAQNPMTVIPEIANRFIGSMARIPQPVLDLALPTLGGVTGGIPGMAAGSMAAKGLSMARQDTGQPMTGAGAFRTAGELAKTGALSAATGVGLKVVTGGFHALRVARNVPLRAGFLRSVRDSFLNSKKLAGESFGKELDALAAAHPKQTVDLSMELARVQERTFNNPAFKSMLERAALNSKESTLVQSLLNQPSVASTLTIQESQLLKNVVSRMMKQRWQQVSPELTDAHLDANDFYHGIRLAQLNAFPGFKDIAAKYHQTLTSFRMVKPYLTPAALEPALLSQFGNRAEIQESVRELLSKETVQEITRFVKASLLPQRARTATKWVAGGLTIGELIRRTTK